ncbi:uncharacterized protein TRIADDRAFT_54449 [Trichoplax adhaerens]|uniref:Uncharacterized protein n=1 Tax=Trichoplax adhaerens TaxID=10228 RepID=B3RS23_TRIAD|nr:predicted protein [Trichoplax adhaerens]EDV26975.1 predicted protein [Trichoplax adhaerens]|eukprot:XP_002110971.1 predicted protein [Trichoplax adhaerens]
MEGVMGNCPRMNWDANDLQTVRALQKRMLEIIHHSHQGIVKCKNGVIYRRNRKHIRKVPNHDYAVTEELIDSFSERETEQSQNITDNKGQETSASVTRRPSTRSGRNIKLPRNSRTMY